MRTIKVRLDRKRTLLYAPAAFLSIMSTLHMTFEEIGQELSKPGMEVDAHILGMILWAGLVHEDPELSLGYVKGLVGNMGVRQRMGLCRPMLKAFWVLYANALAKTREIDEINRQIASMRQRVDEINAEFPRPASPKLTTVGKSRN